METLFMIFMTVVVLMIILSALVIVRDVVKDRLEIKRREDHERQMYNAQPVAPVIYQQAPVVVPAPVAVQPAPVVAPVEQPVAAVESAPVAEPVVAETPAPVVEEVKPEVAVTESAPVEDAPVEGAVTFSADKSKTLDEKYAELDAQSKKYYDEIVLAAAAVEGVKRFKNLRYEEYKVGSLRVVRMLIKRDTVYCEFVIHNASLRTYVVENNVSVKQAATVIKVTDATAVQAVKDTIAIAVKAIEEEKEAKKQLARERRREKRKAAAAEAE